MRQRARTLGMRRRRVVGVEMVMVMMRTLSVRRRVGRRGVRWFRSPCRLLMALMMVQGRAMANGGNGAQSSGRVPQGLLRC